MSRVVVIVCLIAAVAWAAPVPIPEPKSPLGFDRYLVPETASVAVVNVKAILKSPLFEKNIAKEAKALLALPMVAPLVKAVGVDPLTEIDRVVSVSGRHADEKNPSGGYIIVQGKFSDAALRARLDKLAKDDSKLLTAHGVGAARLYEVVTGGLTPGNLFVAVVDRGTVVLTPTKAVAVRVQDAARAKKVELKHKEMAAFLAKMKPEPAVQVVALAEAIGGMVPDPATGKSKTTTLGEVGVLGVKVEIAVKDDARFKVEVTGRAAEEVKKYGDMFEQMLVFMKPLMADQAKKDAARQPVVKFLDGLKSQVAGKVLTVEGVIDADLVRMAAKDLSRAGEVK